MGFGLCMDSNFGGLSVRLEPGIIAGLEAKLLAAFVEKGRILGAGLKYGFLERKPIILDKSIQNDADKSDDAWLEKKRPILAIGLYYNYLSGNYEEPTYYIWETAYGLSEYYSITDFRVSEFALVLAISPQFHRVRPFINYRFLFADYYYSETRYVDSQPLKTDKKQWVPWKELDSFAAGLEVDATYLDFMFGVWQSQYAFGFEAKALFRFSL